MGLCKCPKRKVTNLFCFEHRVNVCEHCLVENHSRCVVQSYLNWLKDSDYNPSCALCSLPLVEGTVVRLMCYDIFHTDCLEKHYSSLPSNTAPAGYKCYTCDSPIFPALNQGGRVVDALKETLAQCSWARVGLGLPLIDDPNPKTKIDESYDAPPKIEDFNDDESLHGSILSPPSPPNPVQHHSAPEVAVSRSNAVNKTLSDSYSVEKKYWDEDIGSHQSHTTKTSSNQSDFMVPIESNMPSSSSMDQDLDLGAFSRKLFAGSPAFNRITLGDPDPDADKYKRRSALSWLRRWLKSRMLRSRHDVGILPRKATVLLLIGLLAFFTLIIFATKASKSNNDPSFDPLNNPNIHVDRHVDGLNDPNHLVDPLQALHPAAVGGV